MALETLNYQSGMIDLKCHFRNDLALEMARETLSYQTNLIKLKWLLSKRFDSWNGIRDLKLLDQHDQAEMSKVCVCMCVSFVITYVIFER